MCKKKMGSICAIIVLAGICAVIGMFFPKWNRQQILTENLKPGEQYLLEEDYEAAIVAFTKAIETDPKCIIPLYALKSEEN